MSKISSIYRITALLLAFLMFSSTVGFTADMHYCQGKLKSVSLIGKAKSCHDAEASPSVAKCLNHPTEGNNTHSSIDKKGCCSNRTALFQSDQNQFSSTADLVIDKQVKQHAIALPSTLTCKSFLIIHTVPAYSYYKPPLLSRDIPVLFQSFLI